MSKMHKWMGKKAKDTITGFEGTITGYAQYMTGCDQFLLQPEVTEAEKYPDGHWLDEQRLELQRAKRKTTDNSKAKGACGCAPVK